MRIATAFLAAVTAATLGTSCGGPANTNTSNNTGVKTNSSPAAQNLTVVDRPKKIKDQMAARGEQDQAKPTIKIIEPAANSTVNGSTVKVKLNLSGDLKGYKPMMDETTHAGNHIHVIFDNQPYEAYYNLDQPFELRNVTDGEHTLRVFPSRPWHESFKNAGAFQMVRFTVQNGGANANKPATTNSGQQMSNAHGFNAPVRPSTPEANAASTPEGKDMQNSTAGPVDAAKPLLTYSRPKGEYKGEDASAIMIDFWLSNAKLTGEGGEYRVRYTIDNDAPKFIDKWEPIWLSGWTAGKHTVKLELVDKNGTAVDNGGYNSTTREITITQ